MTDTKTDYALAGQSPVTAADAPDLAYLPPMPKRSRQRLGLIGCGGITHTHLTAYRKYGWDVVAMVDLRLDAAMQRQQEFYPDATVSTQIDAVLSRADVEVVDIALHPEPRAVVIEQALRAGKHVLSQKPFAIDLDHAGRLIALADQLGLRLAVNQNGRWAPHVAYARAAVDAGLLGKVSSIDLSVHWNHNWVVGTAFDHMPHLVLYDFAIHWFDMVNCSLSGARVHTVRATVARLDGQRAKPPLGAHAILEGDGVLATVSFNGNAQVGNSDRTLITGSSGMIESVGTSLNEQQVTLHQASGVTRPVLSGQWFPDGFAGTMGELLCAIEQGREPSHNARHNVHSLEIAFATIASAEAGGMPIKVGYVRRIEPAWLTDTR